MPVFMIILMLSSASLVRADEQVPTPWNGMDIGSLSPGGAAKGDADTFTLTGGGGGLSGTADGFQFVYQAFTGDCSFSARITPGAGAANVGDAGLMVRDALATTSNFIAVVSTPGQGNLSIYRNDFAPATASVSAGGGAVSWVKLIKRGAVVIGFTAPDKSGSPGPWKQIGAAQPIATGMIYLGMCLTGPAAGSGGTATFDHVLLASGNQVLHGDGDYTLTPEDAPAMMLAANGAGVSLALPTGAANQTWHLVSKGGGFYAVRPSSDETVDLTVPGAQTNNGIPISISADQGLGTQLWSFTANGNGAYSLRPQFNQDICLDDFGGNSTVNAVIDIWAYNSNDPHLEWIVSPS